MDMDSYEQIEMDPDFVGDARTWLLENAEIEVMTADGEHIGVEPPMFVELTVTETEPGFKGDTVQGGTKPATLETGAVIQVPMFINIGEKLQIDTREGGRYIKRA
jgi:elongation factor P